MILKTANLRENTKTETKDVQRQAAFSHMYVAKHLPPCSNLDELLLFCNSACKYILDWEGKWRSPDTSVQVLRYDSHGCGLDDLIIAQRRTDSYSSWIEVQRSDIQSVEARFESRSVLLQSHTKHTTYVGSQRTMGALSSVANRQRRNNSRGKNSQVAGIFRERCCSKSSSWQSDYETDCLPFSASYLVWSRYCLKWKPFEIILNTSWDRKTHLKKLDLLE